MNMDKVQEYREASATLLNQAYAELAEGDTRQASEKGWGATAQLLKAIAEKRGEEHQDHKSIRNVLFKVSREAADEKLRSQMRTLFRTASDLHTNWYENWDTAEMVGAGLDDVQQLLGLLETVFDADC